MKKGLIAIAWLISWLGCSSLPGDQEPATVSAVMDDVISRLYRDVSPAKYAEIDDQFMLNFLTGAEKQVLATRYLSFTVNVPVVVSLMRDKAQNAVPFWLEESGFVNTHATVKSESYEYEVWEKSFDAGHIGLGINGFDKHRPVYFICVAPQRGGSDLRITDLYPDEYEIMTMEEGAFTYHDWSDLKLIEVPEKLRGQQLFTTVRGRAREAHVIGAFRTTPYPSSKEPDQIMLTWSGSPKTSVDLQWRTDTTVRDGVVRYWVVGNADTLHSSASLYLMDDRMLMNDRYINRFTARLQQLTPGTKYFYQVGSPQESLWSDVASFETEAPAAQKFSFIWFGDTHTFPDSGKIVNLSARHEDAKFYSIAGDIVTTGLNRDDWDRLFRHAGDAFANKPLMPVPGNHDRQDGLGAKMYYDLFSLPLNGPEGVDPESSYAFEYGNALFLMIDATSDVDAHIAWIEEKLRNTKAIWKFAMFHFPPYNFEEPYPDIQEAWVPLFDQYHVDIVMGGHIHYYMRSNPMKNGKVVSSFREGTVYAISISKTAMHEKMPPEPYAVTQYAEGYFYQYMQIDDKTLTYTTFDDSGAIRDKFIIRK